MANFCNLKEQRITEVTLPYSMDPGAKSVTIGLWGFNDYEGNELHLVSTPYVNVKKGGITGYLKRVRLYELSSYHTGSWEIDAVTKDGGTWDTLTVHVSAPKDQWGGDSSQWTQEKKLASLDAALRPKVARILDLLRDQGFQPKVFFGWRSVKVQLQLFNRGVTKVKFSFHNAQKPNGTPNAYAADIVDSRWGWGNDAQANGFWDALGDAAHSQGLVWGGDWTTFKDVAHVQNKQNSELAAVKRESGL